MSLGPSPPGWTMNKGSSSESKIRTDDEANIWEGAAYTRSGGDEEIDAFAVCKSGEYDNGH